MKKSVLICGLASITYMQKVELDNYKKKWYIIDAKDKVLGRLATKVACILQGKHKSEYTPNKDCGDFVIVINAKDVKLTGNKLKKKIYYHHSLYPGGLKQETYEKLLQRKPELIIEKAVKNMLPKNRLARKMFKKLKVYKDEKHPHQAQKPIVLEI